MTTITRPRSDRRPVSVVLALGSNLGDRRHRLREGIFRLSRIVRPVRISSFWETAAVDAPDGSPDFLNAALAGSTVLGPHELLAGLNAIEKAMGRVRTARNAPRPIDIDLIFHGPTLLHTPSLTLPHPRYREREFVLAPLRELELPWVDPESGVVLERLVGSGRVERVDGDSMAIYPSPRWRTRR